MRLVYLFLLITDTPDKFLQRGSLNEIPRMHSE